MKLYTSSACTTEIGSGTKADFAGAGISVAITANTTVTIYAKSFDAADNASACTSMASYTHDNILPAAPGFTSVTPASPASSTTPAVVGTTSTDTVTIKLYDDNTCGTQIGTGTKAAFTGAGLTATVTANVATPIHAKSLMRPAPARHVLQW